MNFFFRWAHAAAGELWQDETSHRVSSRTSEAQFPAHLCPPFPPHSKLSFPSPSPPSSLAIPLTHFPSLSRGSALYWLPVSGRERAACALSGSGDPCDTGQDTVLVTQLSTVGPAPATSPLPGY